MRQIDKNTAQVAPHLARHRIKARRMVQRHARHTALLRKTNAGAHARTQL
jgi:hypothetical protein